MINTPEANVALTAEQLNQIEAASSRLKAIENEIVVATKLVNSLKNDCSRIYKEKEYQESIIETMRIQVKEAQDKHDALNGRNSILTTDNLELEKEMKEKSSVIEKVEKSLKERESQVEEKETQLSVDEKILYNKASVHEQEKEKFMKNVAKLKEVIKTLG